MKKSILFVDDDKKEIERFETVMKKHYRAAGGVSLESALQKLRNDFNVRHPDLVLLDLYYGPKTTPEKRSEIQRLDEQLSQLEDQMKHLLLSADQSPDEGFKLAHQVRVEIPTAARAFFSRKAFLRDALRAQEEGLPLIEKPDPDQGDKEKSDPYRAALSRNTDALVLRLDRIIRNNTFWVKYRDTIIGVLAGFFVSFIYDVFKGVYTASPAVSMAFFAGAAFVAAGIWFAKSLRV